MMIALKYARSGLRRQGIFVPPLVLYPTERRGAIRRSRPRRLSWRAAIGVGCLAAVAACRGSDDGRSDDASARSREVPVAMPSAEQLAGFTRVALVPADPPAMASGTGKQAPTGNFWYRVGSTADDDGNVSFEWYVHATHLQAARAYRLDLTVDDNNLYSIGSGAADASGSMTSHGTEVARFADQYCVGAPTGPLAIAGRHVVMLMVKSDGSGSGPASAAGALTDPGRSYPCHGNGDGLFEYWLKNAGPGHARRQPGALTDCWSQRWLGIARSTAAPRSRSWPDHQ